MNVLIKFVCLTLLALALILSGFWAAIRAEKRIPSKTEEVASITVATEAVVSEPMVEETVAELSETPIQPKAPLSVEEELGLSLDEIDGEHVRGSNDNFFGMFCGLAKQGESAAFLKTQVGQPRNTRVSRELEQVRQLTQHPFADTEPRLFYLSGLKDNAIVIPVGGNANLVLYRQAGVLRLVQKGAVAAKIKPPKDSLVPMEFHATKNHVYESAIEKSLVSYVMKRFYELQRVRKGELDIRFTYEFQSRETMLSVSPGQLKNVDQEDELNLFEVGRLKASPFAASFDNTTVLSLYSEAIHRPMSGFIQTATYGLNPQDVNSVLVLSTREFKVQAPTPNVVLARRQINGKAYVQIAYPNLDKPLTHGFHDLVVELFSIDNPLHVRLTKVLVEEPTQFSDV